MEDYNIPKKDPPRPKRVKKFYMRARPMYDRYAHVINAMGHASSAEKTRNHANMLRQELSKNYLEKQFVTHDLSREREEKRKEYMKKFGDLDIKSMKQAEAFDKILDDQIRFLELLVYGDPSEYSREEKLELLAEHNVYEEVSENIQRVMLAHEKAQLEAEIAKEQYNLAQMDFLFAKEKLEQLKY